MGDFKQAIEWMKEKKKVTRSRYKNIYWSSDGVNIYKYVNGKISNNTTHFMFEDFNANDWEIYQDEDNWSLCGIPYLNGNWITPMYHSMSNQIVLVANPTEEYKKYYNEHKLCGYDKVKKMIDLILKDLDNDYFRHDVGVIDEVKNIIKKRFGR